jgi:hypothetical protein
MLALVPSRSRLIPAVRLVWRLFKRRFEFQPRCFRSDFVSVGPAFESCSMPAVARARFGR